MWMEECAGVEEEEEDKKEEFFCLLPQNENENVWDVKFYVWFSLGCVGLPKFSYY